MWLDNKLKSETRTLDYGHNKIINAFELQKNNFTNIVCHFIPIF